MASFKNNPKSITGLTNKNIRIIAEIESITRNFHCNKKVNICLVARDGPCRILIFMCKCDNYTK